MTKARVLADFISDGSPLADGTVDVSEVSGAAPLASPSFTGNLTTGGNITLDEASASAHGEATKLLTASGNGYYQDLRISANDYDFRYGPSAWNSAYSALQISSTGNVVFNESGLDADFRVESDSNAHMLFVDAGNNRVGVGTSGTDYIGSDFVVQGRTTFNDGQTTVGRNLIVDGYAAAGDDNILVIGTQRSSGGPFIGYGLGQNNTDSYWSATYDNFSGSHSVLVLNGAALQFLHDRSNSQTTVGAEVTTKDMFSIDRNEAVFNQDSVDQDFRVESDSNTHALFVDAEKDQVLVGTASTVTASNCNILKVGTTIIANKYVVISTSSEDIMTFGRTDYQCNVGGQIILVIADGGYSTRTQTYTINFGANWYAGSSLQGSYTVVANDGGGQGSWPVPTVSVVDNGSDAFVLRVTGFNSGSAGCHITFTGTTTGSIA